MAVLTNVGKDTVVFICARLDGTARKKKQSCGRMFEALKLRNI